MQACKSFIALATGGGGKVANTVLSQNKGPEFDSCYLLFNVSLIFL